VNESAFTFCNAAGTDIHVHRWSPDSKPRAAVQIAHGAAEHGARYARFARRLTAAGFVVYANDHRGHGRTAGTLDRAGIAGPDGWNGMVDDLHRLTAIIREAQPGLPIFLFGHSLGSLMTQQYIQHWGDELAGAVLCGTFGDSPGVAELLPMLAMAAEAAPEAPSEMYAAMFDEFNKPFAPGETGFEWLSRDGAEVRKYVADPWCGFAFSNALVYDNLRATLKIWDPASEAGIPPDLPLLLIAGDRDPAGRNGESVHQLALRYRSQGLRHVSEILYPDARHEILNETNREQVEQDVVAWLDHQLP